MRGSSFTSIATLLAAVSSSTVAAVAWETEAQAASQIRTLLLSPSQHSSTGILSTLYPSTSSSSSSSSPPPSPPLSGLDYFAPCFPSSGDLLFLALPVSQNWKNALTKGANVTFEVGSHPSEEVPDWRHVDERGDWDTDRPWWRRGAMSKLRVNLFGHIQDLSSPPPPSSQQEGEAEAEAGEDVESLEKCFFQYHPDSRLWAPGSNDSPHESKWVRLVVERIYAVGGFGDEHRIGWVEKEVYAQAKGHRVGGLPTSRLNQQQQQASNVEILFADTTPPPPPSPPRTPAHSRPLRPSADIPIPILGRPSFQHGSHSNGQEAASAKEEVEQQRGIRLPWYADE